MRNAATKTGALFLDLNEIVAEGYEHLGPQKVNTFFADARTHTNADGAAYTAQHVIAGLKERMRQAVAEGGYPNAMRAFHGWLIGADEEEADPALRERVEANGENWITRELGVVDRYDAPAELIAALA